jgi:hypothetical protein
VSIETDFDTFWRAYPRKAAKLDARKAWKQMSPPIAEVLTALEWQVPANEWDGGRFTPLPATWLRAGRWMDEEPERAVVSATAAKVLRMIG